MEQASPQSHTQLIERNADQADSEISPAKDISLKDICSHNGIQVDMTNDELHMCNLTMPIHNQVDGLRNENKNMEKCRSETYHCGACPETFYTICHLHQHLTSCHNLGGSYHFDHLIQTAFPKCQSLCQFTQTEGFDFNREGVFDTVERKRRCDKSNGHAVEGALISKCKVRKKAKVKKVLTMSDTFRKVKDNAETHATQRKAEIVIEDVSKGDISDEFDGSDGYITDRTEDYINCVNQDEISDAENTTHGAFCQADNMVPASTIQNVQSQIRSRCDNKSRTLHNSRNRTKSQNSQPAKRGLKKDVGFVQFTGQSENTVVTNLIIKKKCNTKVNSLKNVKKKSTKKNNDSRAKDNTDTKGYEKGFPDYQYIIKVDQKKDKLIAGSFMEEERDSLKNNKKIALKNQSDKKEGEGDDNSEANANKIDDTDQFGEKDIENMLTKIKECIKSNKCDICGSNFTVKQALLRHEQLKHSDQMNFKCDKCDKKFMRNFNLQKHISRVHGGSKGSKCEIEVKTERLDNENASEIGAVEIKTEKVNGEISDKTAVLERCEGEIQIDDQAEVKRRKRRTNEEVKFLKTPHTCKICGLTMPRSKIDVHERLHTGDRPFICKICGKGLISQNKLSRHMLIHGEAKRHTCEICGVGFHMKYKLRMHMHIHTGKKPYLCSICGAEFNHSANLATHTRCVHLQVKPYVCNICGGRYSKRSQLDDHVLSHTTERQFICRYCGKSFKYFKGMRRHEKGHCEDESFKCDQCGLKFARKENLDRHKVSHGDPSFQCKTCKRVLKDSRALQEHEFTHVVAKGCKCSVCGEMFYHKSKYFTHVSIMHKIQKQEAQLMIIDEKLQKEGKQKEVQNMPLSNVASVSRVVAPFDSSMVGMLNNATRETKESVLMRVATENLQLHSQDIPADEKANLIIPPLNPMILYEKNRVTSLDSVAGSSVGIVIGNVMTDAVNFPDHAYGQAMKQQHEANSNHHSNLNLTHVENSVGHHGLNETVLGFVTSNGLTSINNLNSYIGQRAQSMAPLTSLTAGLHQDEHGAIESLRRLQDNPAVPVTMASPVEGIVRSQTQQHNVVISSARTNEDNSQVDCRIQNLY